MYGPGGRSPWLDVDWRNHQRWVVVDGQALNTIEFLAEEAPSAGEPLLFIHGLSGSWLNWLEQLPLFPGRRLIALDLPGFGSSPMPAELISMPGYARLLDRFLEELGIDAATVVGNSMGGLIAAELAAAFPQRVRRLVLISAAGISTLGQPGSLHGAAPLLSRLEPIAARVAGWGAEHAETIARRPRLRKAALRLVASHPERLPAPLVAETIRGAGKPGFRQALDGLMAFDLRQRLGLIACPTLIVWGDRDLVISVRDADILAAGIRDSRKVIFSDTGHLSMLERPAAFNALLQEFLSS